MLNDVFFTGRLGRPPRHYNAGQSNERCNFSIAMEFGRGENRRTEWMDVTLFGAAASTVVANVVVGQELHIKGRIEPAQNNGFDHTKEYSRVIWQVVAAQFEGVTFGRLPRGNGAPVGPEGEQSAPAPAQAPAPAPDQEPAPF